MNKQEARKLIEQGVDPSLLGKLAHRIEDYVRINGKLFCRTPRNTWHEATARERKIFSNSL